MSDRFYLVGIKQLLNMILNEYEGKKEIFGLPDEMFFRPSKNDPFSMKRYGEHLETPLGVAAGPHTQMAQNIIAAYLMGAKYIELKTVQTLDEIEVSKPCIDMEDEGYNCEWSQELKLVESFDEYLKAWIIIHILKDKLGFDNGTNDLGMIFNMSVGYSYEGILKDNVQTFLNNMENSGDLYNKYISEVAEIYPRVKELDIPQKMSNSLTLSTMHGCPPEEIEKIAQYLISERKYDTTIKLNPTLLGKDKLRGILNDTLGFKNSIVPDEAFGHDLKYKDAIPMLQRLIDLAKKEGVAFGIKLTNTLEVINHKDNFPPNETMMYMSGRALHPISVNLADKLQKEFNHTLDISFSAGVDAFNVAKLLKTGIKPITVCSDLLKPGGYGRLAQYFTNIREAMKGYSSIDEYVGNNIAKNLENYATEVLTENHYKKEKFPWDTIKTDRKLTTFDCIAAPCVTTCPTTQEIPTYMYLTSQGKYDEALKVIQDSNPFPNSTGMACDHTCQDKCTRMNYDNTLLIRDIKRFNARNGEAVTHHKEAVTLNGKSIGIIGGGPSGMSAAYFLAKKGFKVDVYEAKKKVGGMLINSIPDFRLYEHRLEADINRIKALGVNIHENYFVDSQKFNEIKDSHDYIHISIGAAASKRMGIEGEDGKLVIGFLEFLEKVRTKEITKLDGNILIIGGGNSAMDAARTAWRLVNKGSVKVVYRRTQAEMPADREEIEELLNENIEVLELTNPIKATNDGLECIKMKLGEPDDSGRKRPVTINDSNHIIPADLVIMAIGQDSILDFLDNTPIETTKWGTIKTDEITHQTTMNNVYAGGDVSRGPSSIINAIADGKEVAFEIMKKEGITWDKYKVSKNIDKRELKIKKATRVEGIKLPTISLDLRKSFDMVIKDLTEEQAQTEANRCLLCDEVCDVCTTVCPNRANIAYKIAPKDLSIFNLEVKNGELIATEEKTFRTSQIEQVLNIGDFCNECGDCSIFCPTSGNPYLDKPKFYLTEMSYNAENDNAWRHTLIEGKHEIKVKYADTEGELKLLLDGNNLLYKDNIVNIVFDKNLNINSFKGKKDGSINMDRIANMAMILEAFDKGELFF